MARLSSTTSTCCCLNRFQATAGVPSSSSSLLSTQYATTSQLARQPRRENSWKNQIVIGMSTCAAVAIVAITLNTTSVKNLLGNDDAAANHTQHLITAVSEKKAEKWSDKQRTCPAWQLNSLETIVPENLPRPSFRRGWPEPAADSYSRRISPAAPPAMEIVASTRISTSKCFSL